MRKIQLIKAAFVAMVITCATFTQVKASWTDLEDITTPAQGRWGAMTFTLGSKIYLGGGYIGNFQNVNDFLSYDPATDKWTALNNLPGSNSNRTGGVTFVINGKAYLGLGSQDYNNFSPMPTYLTDLYEYNPTADTWTPKASFPGEGMSDATVFVVNNKAYIVGGITASGKSAKTWEYDPAANKWTAKADYPDGAIRKAMGFTLNGKGYITGGELATAITNKTYQYDAATNKWIAKADYPVKSWGGVSFAINNKAYVGLGADTAINPNVDYHGYFFVYDAATDTWLYRGGAELLLPRMHSVAVVYNNKAYMGGGWKFVGTSQVFYKDWYSIDPAAITGIKESNLQQEVTIYPNPATDILNITKVDKDASYKVYDVSGRVILAGQVNADGINIQTLAPGTYIAEVIINSNTARKTFVKQ